MLATLHNAVRKIWLVGFLFSAVCAFGQNTQFGYDANGNLLNETVEAVALPQILSAPDAWAS